MSTQPLVTFDLFSALIDSRQGASAAFGRLADRRDWNVASEALYDTWDRANKASQKDETAWISFAEHSQRAMVRTYAAHDLAGDPIVDADWLLGTVGEWPLWDDVSTGIGELARRRPVGVLSNVDDVVFRATAAAPLLGDGNMLTSEFLGCYKPSSEIYVRARGHAEAGLVHVATSARDVRGALEAGIAVIRLRRPGHDLDLQGPRPDWEAGSIAEVGTILEQASFPFVSD